MKKDPRIRCSGCGGLLCLKLFVVLVASNNAGSVESLAPVAVLIPSFVAFAGAVHGVCRLLVGFEGAPQ